ncbi:AbiH family protein [Paenibacillus sp. FSL H7-0350]|uniref:AbiH family protein n=1 Tax=Paenibacillus sp. FSL H7-0350 TaxID=2975345 RepID=UPI003158B27C
MNLNIIGNGFDLFHGLPSSYYYFGCYLIKNDPGFYEELAKMYNLKYAIFHRTYPDFEYDYVIENIFWSDFEKHLGSVDEEFILNTHDYDLGLENDDPITLDMVEDLAAESLKKAFVHWISDTLDKEKNYKIIRSKMNNSPKSIQFNKDDRFLVFNYTHTLQKIYGISDYKIFYVHGECTGDEDDELVVGHGDLERITELKEIIKGYEKDFNFTQKYRNKIDEHKCLLRYIQRLKKDVESCKMMCNYFYNSFPTAPETITVYGMSLGEVDLPYLKDLRSKWPNAHWHFSYYSNNDRQRVEDVVSSYLELSSTEFDVFELQNDLAEDIQECIIMEQNISTYATASNSFT